MLQIMSMVSLLQLMVDGWQDKMTSEKIIVFDIGGTNVKYGLSDLNGLLSDRGIMKTSAPLGVIDLFVRLGHLIDRFTAKKNIVGIAISTAGIVDSNEGKVLHASDKFPGYSGFAIKKKLEDQYKLPVSVINDVNAAALGELWKGDHKEDTFIAITIGTGIGGAMVVNGHVMEGHKNLAGEIGHVTLIHKGHKCDCGHNGCFECYGSARALDAMIEDYIGPMSTLEFFNCCKAGNKSCINILNAWIDYLAEGLRSLVHVVNPPLILIGGGVSSQGRYLTDLLNHTLNQKVMPIYRGSVKVEPMTLGADANLIGAVYHFVRSEGDKKIILQDEKTV